MTPTRIIGKNLAFKTATEIMARLLSFIFYVALARALGQESFGLYTLLYSVGAMAVFLVDPGLNTSLVRRAPRMKGYLTDIAGTLLGLKIALAFAATLACVIYGAAIGDDRQTLILLLLMGITMSGFALLEYAGALFRAQERMECETWLMGVGKVGVTTFAVATLMVGGDLFTTLLVMTIAQGTTTLWALVWAHRRGVPLRPRFDLSRFGELLHEAAPLAAMLCGMILFLRIDMALAPFLGLPLDRIGSYAAGLKILDVWMAAPTLLMAALFPTLSRLAEEDKTLFELWIKRALVFLLVGGLTGALVGVRFANELVHLIYGQSVTNAVASWKILCAASVFMFLRHGLLQALILENRAKSAALLLFAGVGVITLLNMAFVPGMGSVGMAWARFGGDFFLMTFALLLWLRGR